MLRKCVYNCGQSAQLLSTTKNSKLFIELPNTRSRFWRTNIPDFPTYFLGRNPRSIKLDPVGQTLAQTEEDVKSESKEKTEEVIDLVDEQILNQSCGRLFAIVGIGKHQHKITSGDLLMVNCDMGGKNGQRINLEKVLLIGSKDFTLMGRPLLPRDLFKVEATIVEKNLSQTKISQVYRKRQRMQRLYFNREYQTTLRINNIELLRKIQDAEDRFGFDPKSKSEPSSYQ